MMRRRQRDNAALGDRAAGDRGSALILALVTILVGSLIVLPVLKYTLTVTRANRVNSAKADRVEAVKAGLRVALYDPVSLYQVCVNTGPSVSQALATPPGLSIATRCNTMSVKQQDLPTEQRYALTTVQALSNVAIPPAYVASGSDDPLLNGTVSPTWCTSVTATPQVPCGKPYPGNGNPITTGWMADTSTAMQKDKIFAPPLPPFSNSLKYAAGYDMPAAEGPCKVYFPGKYLDPIVITGSTPVYFASGVYYFENTVKISGNANVVVGTGAIPGCVESDAIAV
ncbi:MAG: hypothetical protein JWN99_3167, partial [Ilumatobacteraceae bacterium]|nr:hypothetical protein [Ilumatobacteraceae bacterium]